jgi:hypothetical protein
MDRAVAACNHKRAQSRVERLAHDHANVDARVNFDDAQSVFIRDRAKGRFVACGECPGARVQKKDAVTM